MSYFESDYGDRLRTIRKRLGYTTTEVAKAIHISQSYLSAFENKRRTPDLDILEKILGFYDVTFGEFFGGYDMPDDIARLVSSVRSLSAAQRTALNGFLDTIPTTTSDPSIGSIHHENMEKNTKENSEESTNDLDPMVERIAAHFEGEYGVHDPDMNRHIVSLIRRAQAKNDLQQRDDKD